MQSLAGIFWIDAIIVLIILISVIVGFGRGAIKTSASILSWMVAAYSVIYFAHNFSNYFNAYISNDEVRIWLTRIIMFIVIMIIGNIIGVIMNHLIIASGMKGVDRLLGLALGMSFGIFIIVSLIILAKFTNFSDNEIFQQSKLIPYFMDLAVSLESLLPDSLIDFIHRTPHIQISPPEITIPNSIPPELPVIPNGNHSTI